MEFPRAARIVSFRCPTRKALVHPVCGPGTLIGGIRAVPSQIENEAGSNEIGMQDKGSRAQMYSCSILEEGGQEKRGMRRTDPAAHVLTQLQPAGASLWPNSTLW